MSPNGVYRRTPLERCAGLDIPEYRSALQQSGTRPRAPGHEIYKPEQINYRKLWEREIGTGEAIFPLVRPARQLGLRCIAGARSVTISIAEECDR